MRLAKVVKPVISGSGATATLTERDSGSMVLFDRATGITFTLPVPRIGLTYDFAVTVTGTGAYKTITNASTQFVRGTVNLNIEDAETAKGFTANGTSHVAVNLLSAETGWLLGGHYTITCVSTTVWEVTGNLMSSGTITTPFTTS